MLQVTSVEVYKESRELDITVESASQEFRYVFCGNFTEEAVEDTDDPDFFGINDDHEVVKYLQGIVPPFRLYPVGDQFVSLGLAKINIKDRGLDKWELNLVYDTLSLEQVAAQGINGLPIEGGNEMGPSEGEPDNSNEFTQLSFNAQTSSEVKTISRKLKAIVKSGDTPGDVNLPSFYVVGEPAPIGLDSEGNIEGTEVFQRDFTFQITQYFTPARLTYKYLRRLYKMAGTYNDKKFFGFPPGSVLFKGGTTQGDMYSSVPVTFDFAVRPNFTFRQVADTVLAAVGVEYDPADPSKTADKIGDINFPEDLNVYSGWDYVEYIWNDVPDTNAKMVLKRPDFRLVHKMYESSDFDKLQL